MICGCAGISRPARSRSSLRTSRDRRGSWTSSGPRTTRRHSRSIDESCARPAHGRVESRSTRKAMRSSSPSRPHRERSLPPGRSWTDSARDRFAFASASTRVRRSSPTKATSVPMSTAPPASRRRGTAARCSSPSATRALLDGDSCVDLGEHRFKDLAAAERVYQLGDARVSTAPEPLPDEPPRSGDAVPRPRARARRGRGAARARRRAAPDHDRAGRDRQDAAGAPGCCRGFGRVSGRHLVGRARAAA